MARVIKSDTQTPGGAAAVLKLTDFMEEARAVVLDARKEAARITTQARAKAEQGEREAAERGYEEGFARGRSDGHAEGRRDGSREALANASSQACDALSCATQVSEGLIAAKNTALQDARDEVLDLALAVAERIVGRVAARDIAAARENLAKALSMASCSRRITVKVNPSQLAALRTHCREIVESLAIKGKVSLDADEQVGAGGVRVFTDNGQIDATIETQLSRVVDALVGVGDENSTHDSRAGRDGNAAAEGQFFSSAARRPAGVRSDEPV